MENKDLLNVNSKMCLLHLTAATKKDILIAMFLGNLGKKIEGGRVEQNEQFHWNKVKKEGKREEEG